MKFLGTEIRAEDPEARAASLSALLELPAPENGEIVLKDCRIAFVSGEVRKLPEKPEGYYVGLDHLAFRSTDLAYSVKRCLERGTPLKNGSEISYNPQIWGPGMDYVNPLFAGSVGTEICQRLDLPEKRMDTVTDGLEHIGIPVRDLSESIRFYERFGFTVGTHVLNHRESDGADIDVAMLVGDGVILETYEFLHMDHEEYKDQPFAALVFRGEQEGRYQGPNGETILVRR